MKKLAYITSVILFYSFSVLFLFILIFSILSYFEYKFDVDIPFVDILQNHAKVNVPLLGLRINIPFNFSILIM